MRSGGRGRDQGGGRADVGLLILRLALGLIMLMYGCQKMLGLFGGHGFSATVTGFEQGMGIPPVLGMLAIATEFFGALGILLGLLNPVASGAMAINMAVATVVSAKRPDAIHDLFTSGDPGKMAGILYPLLLCLVSVAVCVLGPGKFSLDAKLFRRS